MTLRKRITIGLAFAISGLFLYLAFRNIHFGKVLGLISQINPWWVLLSICFHGGAFLAMAARSKILLRPLYPYRYFRLFKSVMVAFAGNNVLPLRMGEFLRVDYLARHGKLPHSSCLAVVIFERLLDLFWLLILFFGVLPLVMAKRPSGAALILPGAVVSVAVIGAIIISRYPEPFLRLVEWISRIFGEKLSAFVNEKVALFVRGLSALGSIPTVLSVFCLTAMFWTCYIMMVQMWLLAFGLPCAPWSIPAELCQAPGTGCTEYATAMLILPWFAPMFIQIFLSFGAALPSSPGFVGTYHYFATLALLTLGVGQSLAASFAIVGHAVSVVPFTIIAFLLLFRDFSGIAETASRSLSGEEEPEDSDTPAPVA